MADIVLKDLSIGYKAPDGSLRAVAGQLSATLRAGELTCLIGPNGVGKSTLLRTLAGFQRQLAGAAWVGPHRIDGLTGVRRARLIGVVLTEKPRLRNFSVRELVALGRSPYTGFWGTLGNEDHHVVEQALADVGIAHLAPRQVHTLSDGERQKVMIAKALAQQTPVILLDEPTAFLDFPSKVEAMQLLHRLAHTMGRTILLSTHDIELALQMADTLWLLTRGHEMCVGSPRRLAAEGVLASFINRPGVRFDAANLTIKVE